MTKTILREAYKQGSFAEDFAAPELYKNQKHLRIHDGDWRDPVVTSTCLSLGGHKIGLRPETSEELVMGLDSIPFCNDRNNPDSIPYIQRAIFYSDKIVVYPQMLPDRDFNTPQRGKIENLTRGNFNGFLSRSAAIKVRRRMEAWFKAISQNKQLAKKGSRPKHTHIVFLTMTLPSRQEHGDNEIKRRILQPFFQQLKRLHGVEMYASFCDVHKSQDIHFHVLIDRWIDKDEVNRLWNLATDHLGYYSKYVADTGDINPPSTKIMVCPEDMSLVSYVMKYVSKQPEIRMSCYPPGHVSNENRPKRSTYNQATESVGELGVVVKAGKDQVRKVVSVSYWARNEIKGGMKEALDLGLEVLGDQVCTYGTKLYEVYERRPIEGRSWSMSKGLESVSVHSQECSYRVYDLLNVLKWDPSVKITKGDYHEIYHCNVFDKLLRLDPVLLSDHRTHYLKVYRQLYEKREDPPPIIVDIPVQVDLGSNSVPRYHWQQMRMAI